MPIIGIIASSKKTAANADLAIAHDVSPFVTAYSFSSAAGYGAKYANPAVLPADTGHAVDFSTGNTTIGVGGYQYISSYAWTLGVGFGSRISNTSVASFYFDAMSIAPNNAFMALSTYGSNKGVHGYLYSTTTGLGMKFANPSVLPSPNEEMYGVAVNNASTDGAFVGYSPPGILAYPMSTSGFGTKYANPTPTQDNCGGVDFHPTDASIFLTTRYNDYATAYAWTNGSGFGAKYANASPAVTNWATPGEFSPSGNAVAFGLQASYSPYIEAYAWSNSTGWGTKYSAPSTIPSGQTMNLRFKPTGDVVSAAMNTGAYTISYAWSDSSGFGAKYSNPATPPAGYPLAVSYSR